MKVVHDSMCLNKHNKYGFRVGDIVEYGIQKKRVNHITMAGEIIFDDFSWDSDWELAESHKKVGKVWSKEGK